jgi:alpha-beta hydrolase superfamily lysophospholipase
LTPQVQEGWIPGAGRRLWHHRIEVEDPIGGVLLLHGYSEHSGRYTHVLTELADHGFTVFAPTHRGHGRTATLPGLIRSVDTVIQDWRWVADALQNSVGEKPLFVVAHSMGALLSVLLLDADPRFHGAVLNGTPLTVPDHIATHNRWLARVLGGLVPWLPLQSFYDPTRSCSDAAVHAAAAADPLIYKGRIRAGTGAELLRALPRVEAALGRLRLPLLITHGGADRTVAPSASARLHANAGSVDKELQLFDGLLHEVHQEPSRDQVIGRWAVWMRRHAKEAQP